MKLLGGFLAGLQKWVDYPFAELFSPPFSKEHLIEIFGKCTSNNES